MFLFLKAFWFIYITCKGCKGSFTLRRQWYFFTNIFLRRCHHSVNTPIGHYDTHFCHKPVHDANGNDTKKLLILSLPSRRERTFYVVIATNMHFVNGLFLSRTYPVISPCCQILLLKCCMKMMQLLCVSLHRSSLQAWCYLIKIALMKHLLNN